MKVRGRAVLAVKRHAMTTDGVMGAQLHAFLTSGLDGGDDQSVEDKQLGWQCYVTLIWGPPFSYFNFFVDSAGFGKLSKPATSASSKQKEQHWVTSAS